MAFVPEKIALDTSVLVQKKGVLEKIREQWGKKTEIAIPFQVKQELETLKNRDQKMHKKIVGLEEEQKKFGAKGKKVAAINADEALVELSQRGFFVLSLDQKLKKKIREKNGKCVEMRGNHFYTIMED